MPESLDTVAFVVYTEVTLEVNLLHGDFFALKPICCMTNLLHTPIYWMVTFLHLNIDVWVSTTQQL